ncbi:MAG: hypothetical protein V3T19_05655, partial [Acidiferrobacterales bacterium]
FGDIPVLTELAGQVAAGGAEREHGCTGQKVIQRFFFDRVYTEAAGAAIGSQDDFIVMASTDEAQTALTLA